jgi:signal transduction histidine kinase
VIERKERMLYANLLGKFLDGDKEQVRLASLLGYRLLRRGTPPGELLDLHAEALQSRVPAREAGEDAGGTFRLSMILLKALFRGYTESFRDAQCALEEKSREYQAQAADLERQVRLRTQELDDSRKELVQKLEEISRDQVAMLSMIEDQNRVNTELRATREKLAGSEKLAILGKLSLGLSHELRNPLGVIESAAALLEESLTGEKKDLGKWTARIREHTRLCNRVIEGILGFSIRANGARDLFPAEKVVDKAVEKSLEKNNAGRRIAIAARTRRPLWIRGDEDQMVQALCCLIANGLEAMEPEGKLVLTLGMCNGGKEHVASHATITVTDDGRGIEEGKLPLIFEPFYSTKEGRLGLGLPLADAIVKRHQGSITVTSSAAAGTSVTISLPLAATEENGKK